MIIGCIESHYSYPIHEKKKIFFKGKIYLRTCTFVIANHFLMGLKMAILFTIECVFLKEFFFKVCALGKIFSASLGYKKGG